VRTPSAAHPLEYVILTHARALLFLRFCQVAFLNSLAAERAAEPGPRAHIATTLSSSLLAVRQEVLPWLQYHTDIGFRSFFILWDGGDAHAAALLSRMRHVTLAPLTPPAAANATAEDAARWARFVAFRGNHWQWGGRPGNYALMVKQGFCVNDAIRHHRARAPGGRLAALSDDWLFHLDVDEALLPTVDAATTTTTTAAASRRRGVLRVEDALSALPAAATSARFLNDEAVPERADVAARLREVTLFKSHGRRVDGRVWRAFSAALRPRGHPEWPVFLLYGNGKPAARLSTPFLRQWGPHFFKGADAPRVPPRVAAAGTRRALAAAQDGSATDEAALAAEEDASPYAIEADNSDADNAAAAAAGADAPRWLEVRAPAEHCTPHASRLRSRSPHFLVRCVQVESDAASVLHYPYARFPDLRAKAALASCPGGAAAAAAAAAGNRTGVDACFVMGFDADVFIAAHARNDGSKNSSSADAAADAALRALFDARIALPPAVRAAQTRTGLLRRERSVAVVLAEHERAIAWLRAGGGPPRGTAAAAKVQQRAPPLTAEEAARLEEELAYLAYHM
jgi:hypothetical protein